MDALSTTRSRTYSASKPETDLAEWTDRIKALQRQVDADDEAEQRRLEEEIATARRARLRRSRGAETTDLDYCSEPTIARIYHETSGHSRPNSTQPIVERHETDALRRHTNKGYNGQGATFSAEKKPVSQNPILQPNISERGSEPTSLAAFIGGRATGPRLNKHAPQQDATDPTQFEQRTHITAPHPVFGRGGVALPGLAGQRPSAMRVQETNSTSYRPQSSLVAMNVDHPWERSTSPKKVEDKENKENRTSRTAGDEALVSQRIATEGKSTASQRAVVREQVAFPRTTGEGDETVPHQRAGSRVRATSTPAHATKDTARTSQYPGVRSGAPQRDRLASQFEASSNATRRSPGLNESPSSQKLPYLARPIQPIPRPVSQPSIIPSRDRLASQFEASPNATRRSPGLNESPSSQKLPYLARPIQPVPRPVSQPSIIPPSVVPSPAFMKPPAPKDPSPSISRLQGRGFVQSMVKISSQLESPAVTPPSPPTKPRSPRKSSVLDRWQSTMAASSSAPSAPASPRRVTLARAHPSNAPASSSIPRSSSAEPVKQLRTRASLPSISQGVTEAAGVEVERNASLLRKMPPGGAPGLGSATTMAIYKPSESTEFPNVDELGIRKQNEGLPAEDARKARASSGLPSSFGKPLSHPTKDRAKKPRKVKEINQERQNAIILQNIPDQALLANRSTFTGKNPQERVYGLIEPNVTTEALSDTADHLATSRSPKVSGVAARWNVPISPTVPHAAPSLAPRDDPKRAFPGLSSRRTTTNLTTIIAISKSSPPTSRVEAVRPAHAAMRHARPLSIGSRPTAMDVALALSQQAELSTDKAVSVSGLPVTDVVGAPPRAMSPEERRKLTLDKYSSIILPALAEEATPTSTPDGTLSQKAISSSSVGFTTEHSSLPTDPNIINHEDEPLPILDVDRLLEPQPNPELPTQTISVDVLSIMGLAATTISTSSNIFYDTELLAVIHRFKSKLDGLVSTVLWIWRGKLSQVGDKEQRKIQELARRYGTNVEMVIQYSEPPQLVGLLGGVLAIRQGSRSRWSSENTTMHLVREYRGVIYIDELDLSVKNLCSAFSYCFTLLNTIYIWYGRGSTQAERQAVSQYVQSFTPESQEAVELREGEDDADDMFWMLLGGQDYAKAHYWNWRKESPVADPVIWRVHAEQGDRGVAVVSSLVSENNFHEGVYIINCIWEFFVLVGCHARGHRRDIKLGLDVAKTLSKMLSPYRPFPPTVHVLFLPSQLPLDLRLTFRNLDEGFLNDANIPDQMNIFSSTEALEYLRKHVPD